jgi:hypothetical protein
MAAADQPLDQRRLTFSQEQGLAHLPSQLKLGELSTEFRSVLWAYIVQELERTSSISYYGHTYVGGVWETILRGAHVFLYHKPADDFDLSLGEVSRRYKTLVWNRPFNEVFDFVQFVMRHPSCKKRFAPQVRGMLEYCGAAYSVIDQGPTIVPIGSDGG